MSTQPLRRSGRYTTRQSASDRDRRDIYKNNQVSFTSRTRRKMDDLQSNPSKIPRNNGSAVATNSAHITPVNEDLQPETKMDTQVQNKNNQTKALDAKQDIKKDLTELLNNEHQPPNSKNAIGTSMDSQLLATSGTVTPANQKTSLNDLHFSSDSKQEVATNKSETTAPGSNIVRQKQDRDEPQSTNGSNESDKPISTSSVNSDTTQSPGSHQQTTESGSDEQTNRGSTSPNSSSSIHANQKPKVDDASHKNIADNNNVIQLSPNSRSQKRASETGTNTPESMHDNRSSNMQQEERKEPSVNSNIIHTSKSDHQTKESATDDSTLQSNHSNKEMGQIKEQNVEKCEGSTETAATVNKQFPIQQKLAQFGFNNQSVTSTIIKKEPKFSGKVPKYHVKLVEKPPSPPVYGSVMESMSFEQDTEESDEVTVKMNFIKPETEENKNENLAPTEINNPSSEFSETGNHQCGSEDSNSFDSSQLYSLPHAVSKPTQDPIKKDSAEKLQHASRSKSPKGRRKKKSRSKSRSRSPGRVTFAAYNPPRATQEDDANTIGSNETTFNLTREEANRIIPPFFVRYRFGLSLKKADIADADLSNQEVQEALSPSQRCIVKIKELLTFLNHHDKDSILISWKNDQDFTTLSTEPSQLPTDALEISKFFQGYKAKIREGSRCWLNFCLHTPNKSDNSTESALKEWSSSHSYSLYKCDIQVENAKVIGWLVYSFSFTNVNALKDFLMSKSTFQWGFKLAAPTQADKSTDWKERLKALNVIVPLEKEETARMIISDCFNPHSSQSEYKTFTDSYLFVGNEHENKTESLSIIFSAMIGRHKFRLMHLNTAFVTCIIKDIDTRILTKDRERRTLREMILNLPSYEKKLGPNKLFLSIDYTANNSDVWFKKKKGLGGAGYILSYYEWDEGEATETIAGLGEYVGHYYGRDNVYAYFSADHWTATTQWVWNESTGKMDTPNQRHLAANILYDPTAEVMEAYQAKQELDNRVQSLVLAPTEQNEVTTPLTQTEGVERDGAVQQLAQRLNDPQQGDDLSTAMSTQVAAEAKSIAQTIRVTTMQTMKNPEDVEEQTDSDDDDLNVKPPARVVNAEHDNDDSNGRIPNVVEEQVARVNREIRVKPSVSIAAQKQQAAINRAKHILQTELDPDLSSIPDAKEGDHKKVTSMVYVDDRSVNSEVTDITDNTETKGYHHGTINTAELNENDNIDSSASITSFKSIRTVDLNHILNSTMSDEEKARTITATMQHYQRKAQLTADSILQSLKNKATLSSQQSASNCDSGQEK